MEFKYKDVSLRDLDVEYNYARFEQVCNGDRGIVTISMMEEDYPSNKKEYDLGKNTKIERVKENEFNAR